jgi:hypothetical protein
MRFAPVCLVCPQYWPKRKPCPYSAPRFRTASAKRARSIAAGPDRRRSRATCPAQSAGQPGRQARGSVPAAACSRISHRRAPPRQRCRQILPGRRQQGPGDAQPVDTDDVAVAHVPGEFWIAPEIDELGNVERDMALRSAARHGRFGALDRLLKAQNVDRNVKERNSGHASLSQSLAVRSAQSSVAAHRHDAVQHIRNCPDTIQTFRFL